MTELLARSGFVALQDIEDEDTETVEFAIQGLFLQLMMMPANVHEYAWHIQQFMLGAQLILWLRRIPLGFMPCVHAIHINKGKATGFVCKLQLQKYPTGYLPLYCNICFVCKNYEECVNFMLRKYSYTYPAPKYTRLIREVLFFVEIPRFLEWEESWIDEDMVTMGEKIELQFVEMRQKFYPSIYSVLRIAENGNGVLVVMMRRPGL